MAKITNLIGSISGRAGGMVFSKGEKGGVGYMRAYQPQVQNPKSPAQTDQRTKCVLVGKLSAVTPKQVLIGMAGTNRRRRAEFLKNLMDVAVIDRTNPGSVVAQIAPADIIFSRGAEPLRAAAGAITATATQVSTTVTLQDAEYAGQYGERLVLAVIDPEEKGGYSYLLYQDILLSSTEAQTVQFNLPTTPIDETMFCLYRIPYVLNEQGVAATKSDIYNNGTLILANIVENTSNIRDYGNSTLQGTTVFTQA